MSARAGIVITGTEVLTGRVADANGPFLAEQLLELGVELAHITICGDRPDDIAAQLRFLADEGVDLIITSGGLGPTADDMTVEVVAGFCGRELVLDEELEEKIAEILRSMMRRFPDRDFDAVLAANRKQAMVPAGAQVIDPVGTAPGVIVPGTPTVLVLPGPPRELQPMWRTATGLPPCRRRSPGGPTTARTSCGCSGCRSPDWPRRCGRPSAASTDSTGSRSPPACAAVSSRSSPATSRSDADIYRRLVDLLHDRHPREMFSTDGSYIDDQVARLLAGRRIATAESCTAGMVAARLTDRAGSSAYVIGGAVVYSNEAKSELLGVDPALIAEHGAVSEPVAEAMAAGALRRFDADTAIAITGIAGPDGGTPDKPVGTVCFSVATAGAPPSTRTVLLPGNRADIRDRSTTVAMHLLRQALGG